MKFNRRLRVAGAAAMVAAACIIPVAAHAVTGMGAPFWPHREGAGHRAAPLAPALMAAHPAGTAHTGPAHATTHTDRAGRADSDRAHSAGHSDRPHSGPAHSAGTGHPSAGHPAGAHHPAGSFGLTQLVAGAGPLPSGWVAAGHTLDVAGLKRAYLTLRPAVLTGPVPVVLLMPGRRMSPDGVLHISGLVTRLGPAVVIVPAGWHNSWNAGDCCGAAYLHHIDDVTFITDAVADVLAITPEAEASRVYAVGFSNGGRMAYDLACHAPGMFAGYMAVEAVPVEACQLARPHDMTVVAQQNDPLLTVHAGERPKSIEGFVEPTVDATVARLRHLDGCTGAPSVTAAGLSVERTWSCPAGTVRYIWYPGGRHDWRAASGSTPGATSFVLQLIRPGGPPAA